MSIHSSDAAKLPLRSSPPPPPPRSPTTNTSPAHQYRIVPLIQRSTLLRLDVGPFLMGYAGCITVDMTLSNSTVSMMMVTILYSLLLLTHIMLVLVSQWYISVRVMVGYHQCEYEYELTHEYEDEHPESSVPIGNQHRNRYTHCYVQPIHSAVTAAGRNRGAGGGIVPIFHHPRFESLEHHHQQHPEDPVTTSTTPSIMTITFHDQVFRASCTSGTVWDDRSLWQQHQHPSPPPPPPATTKTNDDSYKFRPMEYPIHLPLSFYTKIWKGHVSLPSCRMTQAIYGSNTTMISLPTIYQLLQQQLVQPLFIFQLLCVMLWCCDEYWYYAIYTLFALLLLECTLSYTKLKSLQRLHSIGNRHQHQKVYVRRGMSATITTAGDPQDYIWMRILITELIPGDIVSLSVYQESISVPADIVLLHGTAVCDEALLTGESIPQRKQPLQCSSEQEGATEYLDINDIVHKESILFGGTMLLVTTPDDDDDDNVAPTSNTTNGPDTPPPPPDRGVIGMVIRTGFETSQGNLLRTMVHSSSSSSSSSTNSNETHNTMDTFVFISLLLCCAVGAAMYVLSNGWQDERRNHFRLILHVIMIITSVVPPELPMELSLAITNSVSDLIKRCHVFCTEHYRIPYAGQVNICCFDKTGTL